MTITTGHRADYTAATEGAGLLRRILRQHAAGVTVVTVPGPAGFTATSFTSVSLEPALVTFFVSVAASATPMVNLAEHFAIHLLDAGHAAVARQFARRGADRFAGLSWSPSPDGVPLLHGICWLTARTILRQRIGDHIQVVGELQAAASNSSRCERALVYHDGGYASTARLVALACPASEADGSG
jgi:flavin reductase (DIM6/NTAB) family NADH-FMN oxidoreductase RutF